MTESNTFKIMLCPYPQRKKPDGNTVGYIQNRFESFTTDLETLKYHLELGCTFKPAFLIGSKSDDWISQQMFAMDFDSGITIDDAIKKCREHGLIPNAYYESFSSSPELIKFRLLFVLSKPITDFDYAEKCRYALMEIFKGCDVSCKDATRMFFGTDKKFFIIDSPVNDLESFVEIIDDVDISVPIPKQTRTHSSTGIQQSTDVKKVFISDKQWAFAIKNIRLLDKFFNDDFDRLHYEDLMIVASNMNCLHSGLEKVLNRMESLNGSYQGYHFKLVESIASNGIKAMSFNRSSTCQQNISSIQNFIKLNYSEAKKAEYNYLSEMITIDDVKKWNSPDNPIVIKAGTGCGKTYFCLNILAKYVESIGGKMLLLQNRRLAKNMFQRDVENMVDDGLINRDVVTVRTYQSYEKGFVVGDVKQFTHIVFDEAHYFTTDCSFNTHTIESYDRLTGTDAIKVFMTATDEGFFEAMVDELGESIVYDFGVNYSHVKKFICFNGSGYVEAVIDNCEKKGTKAMVFMENSNALFDLFLPRMDRSLFVCSVNHAYSRYIDKSALSDLISDGAARSKEDEMNYTKRFNRQFIFATSALDTGFNIKDESFTDIICSAREIHKIVQWIGRYRASRNSHGLITPQITVHIHNVIGARINKQRDLFDEHIYYMDMLEEHGSQYYDKKTSKEKKDEHFIYHCSEDDVYKVNKLARVYAERQFEMIELLSSRELTWIDILRQKFGVVESSNSSTQDADRISYLESISGSRVVGKAGKDIFFETLNYRVYNEKFRTYKLIKKLRDVKEPLKVLGFEVLDRKVGSERFLEIKKL